MSLVLEFRKAKRTGLAEAFLGGGILAAAVPFLNMTFRSDRYLSANGSPATILMDANWQMMSMLNVLLTVAGACVLYHIEYADHAMQKMNTLPIREVRLFFGKAGVIFTFSILFLLTEAASVAACAARWFGSGPETAARVLHDFGFALLMLLPPILLSLLVSSLCRNMWISLGIGVVCVFAATMLPTRDFVLTLFPFALPFQTPGSLAADAVRNYAIAAAAEAVLIVLLEVIILNVRRLFE